MTGPQKTCAQLALFCTAGFIFFASSALSGESITYDPSGAVRRVLDIDYKPPSKATGIVPKILATKRPFILISPLAPRRYGFGRDLVSWDSAEGKPKGFIIAGARFW